jgi:hypothetical protein
MIDYYRQSLVSSIELLQLFLTTPGSCSSDLRSRCQAELIDFVQRLEEYDSVQWSECSTLQAEAPSDDNPDDRPQAI